MLYMKYHVTLLSKRTHMKYLVIALAFMAVALPSCCMKKNGKKKAPKVEKAAKPCSTGKCPVSAKKAMPAMKHNSAKAMPKAQY